MFSANTPERTCIGCGRKQPKGALVRMVIDAEGHPRIDKDQRAHGRGAYLCGTGCLKAALKRKSFGRAFRGKAVPVDGPGLQREFFGLDAAPRGSDAAQEGEG